MAYLVIVDYFQLAGLSLVIIAIGVISAAVAVVVVVAAAAVALKEAICERMPFRSPLGYNPIPT